MIGDLGETVANVATLTPQNKGDESDNALSQISNHQVALSNVTHRKWSTYNWMNVSIPNTIKIEQSISSQIKLVKYYKFIIIRKQFNDWESQIKIEQLFTLYDSVQIITSSRTRYYQTNITS